MRRWPCGTGDDSRFTKFGCCVLRGRAFEAKHDFEQARSEYNAALTIDPKFEAARQALAYMDEIYDQKEEENTP